MCVFLSRSTFKLVCAATTWPGTSATRRGGRPPFTFHGHVHTYSALTFAYGYIHFKPQIRERHVQSRSFIISHPITFLHSLDVQSHSFIRRVLHLCSPPDSLNVAKTTCMHVCARVYLGRVKPPPSSKRIAFRKKKTKKNKTKWDQNGTGRRRPCTAAAKVDKFGARIDKMAQNHEVMMGKVAEIYKVVLRGNSVGGGT